jgi:hypothetical protein
MGKSKRQQFIDLARRGGGRQDFIDLARNEGLTSSEDMEKVNKSKKPSVKISQAIKKGAKAIPGLGIAMEILDPTELGAAERPLSEEQMSEINQMEEYKKGGRVGLYANINRRKKLGISRPKSKTTISKKAYENMKSGFTKKAKGGLIRGTPKIAIRGWK